MKKLEFSSRIVIACLAITMMSAFYVPLWQILMWAPQYPEGLEMKIWIDNLSGDVKIISALNHYIGMRHIEVSMFPEFQYMKYLVGIMVAIGLLASIIGRRFSLWTFALVVVVAGGAALIDFYLWGYDYGHNLDPTAPIVVPGMSYQPPLIGTKQLLNFTAFSGPDIGGWIFLGIGIGLFTIIVLEYRVYAKRKFKQAIAILALFIGLCSCSIEPQPLNYGEDACSNCKMLLMDKRFGAEIVTEKGKVYKFDDVNCMVHFFNKTTVDERSIKYKLVVDFTQPGSLIDAGNSFYVKSPNIKSPMASQVAAFHDYKQLEKYKREFNGIYLTWGELVTQFK
jgi:copper chaperone NosL